MAVLASYGTWDLFVTWSAEKLIWTADFPWTTTRQLQRSPKLPHAPDVHHPWCLPWHRKAAGAHHCRGGSWGWKRRVSDSSHSCRAPAGLSQPMVSDTCWAFLSLWDCASFLPAFLNFPGSFLQAHVLWTFHSGSSPGRSMREMGNRTI